jgi:hypothetical protein
MCNFALIGAQTDAAALRSILGGPDGELDTHVAPDPRAAKFLPASDSVVCITLQGCSCALLAGVGLSQSSKRSVHFAGPGYVFRRAVATATLRFGGVRLLAYNPSNLAPARESLPHRTATLCQFLRAGLDAGDGVVSIVA